jgi:hypothetical protein
MERDTRKTIDFVMAAIRTLGSLASVIIGIVNLYVLFHYVLRLHR